jgi:hypothetical protein
MIPAMRPLLPALVALLAVSASGCLAPAASEPAARTATSPAADPVAPADPHAAPPVPPAAAQVPQSSARVDGARLTVRVAGRPGEWIAVYAPLSPPAKGSFGYTVAVDLQAAAGPAPAFAYTSMPLVVQAHGKDRTPHGFDSHMLVAATPSAPAGDNLTASYPHVTAFDDDDLFEGVLVVAAGTTAWSLDVTFTLTAPAGTSLLAPRVRGGNGTLGWEEALDRPVPGLEHGSFAFSHDLPTSGCSLVYFLREPMAAGGNMVFARSLDYQVRLPGNLTWGDDGATGYGVEAPAAEAHYRSESYTNRVVGAWQSPPGVLAGEGTFTQADAVNRILSLHLPGVDLDALGLDETLGVFAAY